MGKTPPLNEYSEKCNDKKDILSMLHLIETIRKRCTNILNQNSEEVYNVVWYYRLCLGIRAMDNRSNLLIVQNLDSTERIGISHS